MKIFGKKFYRGNVILLASYTAVSLCLLLIISAIRIEKINAISRNTLYTDNKSNFLLSYAEEDAWEGVVPELMNEYDNFAIYYTVPDKDISIRGILVKGTVQDPPMISGDYFDADDYDTVKAACDTMYNSFKDPAFFLMVVNDNKIEDPLIVRLFSSNYIMDTMYVMTFVSFSLCTILVTFIWLRHRRQQFHVWKLSGYRIGWMIIELTKKYYMVAITGYIAGVVIMKLLLLGISEFNIVMTDMILALLTTIGLGTIMLIGGIIIKRNPE